MHSRRVTGKVACGLALGAAMLAALLVCRAALSAKDPNQGYQLWSRFWLPYDPDPHALGLFHLDKANEMSAEDMEVEMDMGPQKEEAATPKLPGEGAQEGPTGENAVQDSSLLRRDARALGPYEWIEKGRFRGGLRLKGERGALVIGEYTELQSLKPVTFECWVQPDEGAEGVLFSLEAAGGKASAVELRVRKNGRMTAWFGGKEQGESSVAIAPGRWWHAVMIASPGGVEMKNWVEVRVLPNVRVFIDGAPALRVEDETIRARLGAMSGKARVGNDTAMQKGLRASFDEVRISPVERQYYKWDVTWTDPEAMREVKNDRPYLRDKGDLVFAVSFDGTCVPAYPQGAWKGELAGESKGGQPPKPVFREGVRGKAILVGPKTPRPRYNAEGWLNPQRGSFELWFCPYDWDNRRIQSFHDPMEYVPILRASQSPGEKGQPNDVLSFGILHKKPLERPKPPLLQPGEWYHVVGTWEGGHCRLYLNGKPAPDPMGYFDVGKQAAGATQTSLFLDPVNVRLNYNNEQTLVDELRIYSRPLAPEEVANAYARYLPKGELKPLPFAHVDLAMNGPEKLVNLALELLSPERDKVAAVSAAVFGPDGGKPLAETKLPPVENGRTAIKLQPVEVGYGKHRLDLTFYDNTGKEVDRMSVDHDRVRPPWLGSIVGVHDKVLPGWTPVQVEGATVRVWGREIVLGGSGLPNAIVSQKANMLASPMRVILKAGGQEAPLRADADAPKVEKASETAAVTSGRMSGGPWHVETRITTEFDGMMKVEMTLSRDTPGPLDGFVVEMPLKAQHAKLLGYWTGHGNFRGATGYGALPAGEGVVFASNKINRQRSDALQGSFIPYLALADDRRGLAWFAENDKGWSKSMEAPALEVERKGEVVTLRMNVINEKTELTEPTTFVFALHPTPVKAVSKDWRSLTRTCNFGYVDSFSKQQLKNDEDWGNFNIFPHQYNWEAAAGRSKMHQFFYKGGYGYDKPILYIDRNWVGLPPDASEFGGIWYRSGFYRYVPEARNCSLWNLNEWLNHGIIKGFYIDDAWIGTFKDPDTGPAYRLPDGKVQPGFEFFDYREFCKRLRWLFIDNNMEPLIWVHMTQTHFVPALSFADVILDGEDRFLGWGDKRDFVDMWPLDRLRYSNAQKWGFVQVWMNKISADQIAPVEMPHWEHHEQRSYYAALLVHDIANTGGWLPDGLKAGCYDDAAEFVGYWEDQRPVESDDAGVIVSVYKLKNRAAVFIVNVAKEDKIARLTIKPELLAEPKAEGLKIQDCDTFDPPAGEDITKVEKPKEVETKTGEEPKEKVAEAFEDLLDEEKKLEERKKKEGFLFDDHNFQWEGGALRLRVRYHDYRLLVVTWKGGEEADELPLP